MTNVPERLSMDELEKRARAQFDINRAKVLSGETYRGDRRQSRRLGRSPASYDRHDGGGFSQR